MNTLNIPWDDGSGQSLVVEFTGKGNSTIKLSSSVNETGVSRSAIITVTMKGGSVSHSVTVTQLPGEDYLVTEGNFIDSNSESLRVTAPGE